MKTPMDDESASDLAEENAELRRRVAALEAKQAGQQRLIEELSGAEERFREFFDNAPIGKSITAPDGTLLRVNRCLEAMLGYSDAELQQSTFRSITFPEDLPDTQECFRALLAGECDTWNTEKRYVAKDGHLVWAQVVTRLQRDGQNRPLHLLTHVLDITERKQAEQKLLEQRTLLHNLIRCTGSPIFSVDRDFKYTSFNPQHATVMKALYGVEIALGQSLLDYQRPTGDEVQTQRNLERSLAGESFTDEGYSGDELLSRSYFEVSHYPISDAQGQIAGVAVFARDTTAKRRAEENLRRLNAELDERIKVRTAQLEQANGELSAFADSVSHDLRTPLRAIDGFTRILAEEHGSRLGTEGQRLCTVIRDNVHGMRKLIEALLHFSRKGRAVIELGPVDMRQMAQTVYDELVDEAMRERIDFRLGEIPAAMADRTLIRQVWENLISNAIKFSSKRECAHLSVSAVQVQGLVQYAIADDGAGFDMQYSGRLFGIFQRLHSSRDFEGDGVGLALVQRIVRRHGGDVWAEAQVGQGATFYFTLPAVRGAL